MSVMQAVILVVVLIFVAYSWLIYHIGDSRGYGRGKRHGYRGCRELMDRRGIDGGHP